MRLFRSSIIILICCTGCVDPYTPKLAKEDLSALVVDGYIDLNGLAYVKLSRSVEVTANDDVPNESGATVTIKSSDGSEFDLGEEEAGAYSAPDLPVDLNSRYTLYIKTSDGSEYQSDEVSVYLTPPIDSIYYTREASGNDIDINVDARDVNAGSTGYYLWEGSETYEYHAATYSGLKIVNHVPIDRRPDEQVFRCWRTEALTPVTTSTRNLSQNVINGQRVQTINKSSLKFQVRYSILLKQRVISLEEYDFRNLLRKSTELQGSLFAPVPGSVVGNVHSKNNPSEYVLGYFRGQQIQEKRFFIDQSELPRDVQQAQPIQSCQQEATCPVHGPFIGCIPVEVLGSDAAITYVVNDGSGNPFLYYFVSRECGDCRVKGGTTTRPDFW